MTHLRIPIAIYCPTYYYLVQDFYQTLFKIRLTLHIYEVINVIFLAFHMQGPWPTQVTKGTS